MKIETKIKELGFTLPDVPKPVASYIPAVKTGNLVFTAGMLPMVKGKLAYNGKVGADVSLEDGVKAAEISLLNGLAAIKGVAGDLDKIVKVVKLSGYVNSASCFTDQPKVLNGASELLLKIFGDAGKHARIAIGVNELPLNACVELDIIVEVKE
ncbi:MAG: RidA family protein [Candidatus Margulisbacteria bacterium]|nr:RidA family protein [Candidatus Margulisiibacteriota bacterium]MBU1021870.1 RidA family protein [Candidatus Margulisiibacteriota bacterium]MBU1728508.1 RidA family protein [Candidatus Margulisiibacteriota bacterium]MBU1954655.1 RidA family protein [Candidatus Margulisiibacteriota bacterium]